MAKLNKTEVLTMDDVHTIRQDKVHYRFYWTRDRQFVEDGKVYAWGYVCQKGRLQRKVKVELGKVPEKKIEPTQEAAVQA